MTERPFERHPDTRLLVMRLEQAQPGESLSLEELSRVVGRPLTMGDPRLRSARRIVLAEQRLVTAADGKGNLCVLTGAETVALQDGNRRRMGSLVRKSLRQLETVIPEQLDDPQRLNFYASLSFAGAMAHALRPKQFERLKAATNGQSLGLAVAQTLEHLK
jgi:hypothetical protein